MIDILAVLIATGVIWGIAKAVGKPFWWVITWPWSWLLGWGKEKTTEKVISPATKPEGEISFLTKLCPRCFEKINLEEVKCAYCEHIFDPDEVAANIRQIVNERAEDVVAVIDFALCTKTCPNCAESIKLETLVCRYCRHEFAPAMVELARVNALREAWNPLYTIPGGVQYGTRCPRCNSEYFAPIAERIYRCDACGARVK